MIPESLFSSAAAEAAAHELHVDDDWLEAVLENLALARLSRADCISMIEHLEELERSELRRPPRRQAPDRAGSQAVGGEHLESEFNAYDMRMPDAMNRENVHDTLTRAIRCLGSQGHAAAVRQIVFFISSNLDEVMVEPDDEEPAPSRGPAEFDV
jgi:hypothetical protein